MTSPENQSLSALLKKHNLRPDKNLGQNFLTDPSILDNIVDAAEVKSQDTVLEIGAGLGHLTRHLAVTAKQVVAVELDKRLISILEQNRSQHSLLYHIFNYPEFTGIRGKTKTNYSYHSTRSCSAGMCCIRSNECARFKCFDVRGTNSGETDTSGSILSTPESGLCCYPD